MVLKFRVEGIAINLHGKNQVIRNVKNGMVLNCKYLSINLTVFKMFLDSENVVFSNCIDKVMSRNQ